MTKDEMTAKKDNLEEACRHLKSAKTFIMQTVLPTTFANDWINETLLNPIDKVINICEYEVVFLREELKR